MAGGDEVRCFVVTGRVQGVGYRDWVVRRASTLGLDGWVRNKSDGSVELVVAGPPTDLDALRAQLASGPALAQVADVAVFPESSWPEPGFRRAPTL
jgi:acylphosphatase